MAPHALSVAVHYLKGFGKLSGPNLTRGGEWAHVHGLVKGATASAFPAFLWRFEHARAFGPALTTALPLMVPLNMYVMEWHAQSCAMAASVPPSPAPARPLPIPLPRSHPPGCHPPPAPLCARRGCAARSRAAPR